MYPGITGGIPNWFLLKWIHGIKSIYNCPAGQERGKAKTNQTHAQQSQGIVDPAGVTPDPHPAGLNLYPAGFNLDSAGLNLYPGWF